jgi:cation diffusion facilitator family transporter
VVEATHDSERQKRFAMHLSLIVGISMFFLKFYAYALTHSTAILSDAAESIVHVIAVGFAAYSLRLAAKPADQEHHYGHAKISFMSAGFEGAMIIIAALFIIYETTENLIAGIQIQKLGTGLWLTGGALVINAALGSYLMLVGKRKRSLILEANGKHVLTDAWTSFGVVLGVGLAWSTGWHYFDPICAILLAFHILFSGFKLMKQSINGLLDTADPEIDQIITDTLEKAKSEFEIDFHGVRHLSTGDGYRIELHLLFPDELTIKEAHRQATIIERQIETAIETPVLVTTHLEPARAHEEHH